MHAANVQVTTQVRRNPAAYMHIVIWLSCLLLVGWSCPATTQSAQEASRDIEQKHLH